MNNSLWQKNYQFSMKFKHPDIKIISEKRVKAANAQGYKFAVMEPEVDKINKKTFSFQRDYKKYVDFQLIISGVEQMEYVDIDKLIVKKPYEVSNDLIVYEPFDKTSKIVMERGDLAVYFPDDAHIGMPKYQNSSLVYKTVVKVPLNYF